MTTPNAKISIPSIYDIGNGTYKAEVEIKIDGLDDILIDIEVQAKGYGQVEKAVHNRLGAIGNAIAIAGQNFSAGPV
ncbi:hypothetical protein [Bosea sp. ANAM02]|uniref:hypothetical protein n=1 Tax=Bosea sp. ANAM02 TaxID=2020412 RepID=UPI00140EE53E|nr:hypothetical protein [Bosea sp. ANAM02]BCB18014.1 hypothetical protein OCUBac02_09080 [Bosea sp. ANAM02]